jgi:S-(hydroxymethyl)glutathione dehydrogenase/alcohol dehydrogenase
MTDLGNGHQTTRGGRVVKAIVYSRPDEPLQFTEVDLAPPKRGEVTVQVVASGVCRSDLHVRQGDWAMLPVPLVLGHEGAGIVVEVGEGVTRLHEGDHVILSWIAPCGQCRNCLLGRAAQCDPANTFVAHDGVMYDGTTRLTWRGKPLYHVNAVSCFAEYAVIPETGAIPIRADAPLDVVALIGCAVPTGVGAVVHTANVEMASTVAVIGCGAVGLSVIQGAALRQCSEIIALDVNPDKLPLARKLGATSVLDVSGVDAVAAVHDLAKGGVDYAFDAIGHTSTVSQAVDMLGIGGTAVVVGLPPGGAKATFEPLVLVEWERHIVGSNYGSVRPALDFPWLVDLYMSGRLHLDEMITKRRPLSEAQQALDDIERGQVLRTVLDCDPTVNRGGPPAPLASSAAPS